MTSSQQSTPAYQLTEYPVGSLKEIWTLSWPLMLSLFSGNFMLFVDRLFLAHHSSLALNASVIGGMAAYTVLTIPMVIASFSEMFVGRNHGAGDLLEVGRPVWQMLWFSFFSSPLVWLLSYLLLPFFFGHSDNAHNEIPFFYGMMAFAPFFFSTLALTGFFVGTGQVRLVTLSAFLGNGVNIILDPILIFGYGIVPAYGAGGAGLATGFSQCVMTLFLFYHFIKASNRQEYGTGSFTLRPKLLIEGLRVGFPASLDRFLESTAHLAFFNIILMAGQQEITVVAISQSFYLLLFFFTEGLSKGVSSISANLMGAQVYDQIPKVIWAASKVMALFLSVVAIVTFLDSELLIKLFLSSDSDGELLMQPEFIKKVNWALLWMNLFLLFDGLYWIYIGVLSAAGDTRFMLWMGIILNWILYVPGVYILVKWFNGTSDQAWGFIAFYSLASFTTYWLRYRSKAWVKHAEAMVTK